MSYKKQFPKFRYGMKVVYRMWSNFTANLVLGTLDGNITILKDVPRNVNWSSSGKVLNTQLEFKFYSLGNTAFGDF